MALLTFLALASDPQTPADVRWEHRLIVLVATDPDDPRVEASRQALAASPEDVADRKLQLVTVLDGQVSGLDATVAHLAERWSFEPDTAFLGLLVGLDGGVKDRTDDAVDVEAWFARIDSMPMRMQELRRRGEL